jgi:hypothetical protein
MIGLFGLENFKNTMAFSFGHDSNRAEFGQSILLGKGFKHFPTLYKIKNHDLKCRGSLDFKFGFKFGFKFKPQTIWQSIQNPFAQSRDVHGEKGSPNVWGLS